MVARFLQSPNKMYAKLTKLVTDLLLLFCNSASTEKNNVNFFGKMTRVSLNDLALK